MALFIFSLNMFIFSLNLFFFPLKRVEEFPLSVKSIMHIFIPGTALIRGKSIDPRQDLLRSSFFPIPEFFLATKPVVKPRKIS